MNVSRGQFFRLFREIMILAEDRIQCGEPFLPTPEDIFELDLPSEDPIEFDDFFSNSSDSSLSLDSNNSEQSFLVLPSEKHEELPEFYKLASRHCKCDISVTSSVETLSEASIRIDLDPEDDDMHYNSEEEVNIESCYSVSEFYKPETKIHSRFLNGDEQDEENLNGNVDVSQIVQSDLVYEWINETNKPIKTIEKPKSSVSNDASLNSATKKASRRSTVRSKLKVEKINPDEIPSTMSITKKQRSIFSREERKPEEKKIEDKKVEEKKLGEKELLDAWIQFNIWEQRKRDMADYRKGWQAFEPELCADDCLCTQIEYVVEDAQNEEYHQVKEEWLQYLDKHKSAIDQNTQNVFINSCLLLIVKEFIFEYFYESFQYKLVKTSFQTVPNLIYEKLNKKWQVPKVNREEFKRPIEKKPKPAKPIREKRPKSKEKTKKEKSKGTSKTSKESSKKKKEPKSETKKPHKLTQEEKEEMERLKMEEKQRILDEKAAEENKRFIFPLRLAADEDFFKKIFKDFASKSTHDAKDTGRKSRKKKK